MNLLKVAFFLIISCVLLFFSFSYRHFQDTPLTQNDSLLLAKHILEVKKMYALEENDSVSTEEQVDSILLEHYTNITDGSVYYSPDSIFKIFVIEGETCVMNCNSLWESFLHLNNKSKRIYKDTGFTTIRNIHKLPDNKYLIIQERSGREYGHGISILSVTLISFINDSLIYHPIHYRHPRRGENNIESTLSFYQPHFLDEVMMLTYDTQKGRLNYQYGNDYTYCCSIDSAFIYKGYFDYQNGKLIHKKETKRYTMPY